MFHLNNEHFCEIICDTLLCNYTSAQLQVQIYVAFDKERPCVCSFIASFNAIYGQTEFQSNFKYISCLRKNLGLKTANRKLHFNFPDKQDEFQVSIEKLRFSSTVEKRKQGLYCTKTVLNNLVKICSKKIQKHLAIKVEVFNDIS